jgi:cytidylate kinase
MPNIRIAVDGPSGAGKSTLAKRIAEALDIDYIDTGAMYRAIAYKILQNGVDIERTEALSALLAETDVDFDRGRVLLDGADISDEIRTAEVTSMASKSSALPQVREKLVALQRGMGAAKSVVMDGRDIGSNVLPDAEFKFYMTASAEERARRRCSEMRAKAPETDFAEVLAAIRERDYNDTHRAVNPLVKTEDAIEIDTDEIGIDEVTSRMLSIIRA